MAVCRVVCEIPRAGGLRRSSVVGCFGNSQALTSTFSWGFTFSHERYKNERRVSNFMPFLDYTTVDHVTFLLMSPAHQTTTCCY
jgi:hypothetical protein